MLAPDKINDQVSGIKLQVIAISDLKLPALPSTSSSGLPPNGCLDPIVTLREILPDDFQEASTLGHLEYLSIAKRDVSAANTAM